MNGFIRTCAGMMLVLSSAIGAEFSFSPKQWVGKMEEARNIAGQPLARELNRFKALQEGSLSFIEKVEDKTEKPVDVLESLSPVRLIEEKIPEMTIKPVMLKDLEDKFVKENIEKRAIASISPKESDKAAAAAQPAPAISNVSALDDSFHMHVVYLTPADSPSFNPSLPGKPTEKAGRTVINKIDESWLKSDTPFNEDKGHDHSNCVRISNGYYAGFFNNSEYGPHLKGHAEAKAMWGKNWGGAWSEAGAAKADTANRRILFVIDISNSMNLSDPFDDKMNCQRRLAIKQVVTKNSEGVDYGILFYHEKQRAFQKFVSYSVGGKNIYDSLNNYACRGEGGTDMVKSAEDGKAKFDGSKPYDTMVLITDQSYQDTPVEEIRKNSKGEKVVTSRDKLFDVLDHLIRL